LMELEEGKPTGAAPGERSPDRLVQRNGYRERNWQTRTGTVELRIPKLRKGSYFPAFLGSRRLAKKALTAVTQEAYVGGISTRSVDNLVRTMGGQIIDATLIAAPRQKLTIEAKATIREGGIPADWSKPKR
ncbi:transposase, partial [Sphingobium sp. D43FB]|uniref:transposase n=1 Tax=Sphingobium sp. D43FB TaxID=2017595 RepID=UPI0020D07E01